MALQSDLYDSNLGSVLRGIALGEGIARSQLAESTGLTRTTVSKAVGELQDLGLVEEAEFGQASVRGGRRPILLELQRHRLASLGVDIRREKVTACSIDLGGQILADVQATVSSSASASTVLDLVADTVEDLVGRVDLPVLGMGIGSVGPLVVETGTIDADSDSVLADIPLRSWASETLGLPVTVRTGASAAALGEAFRAGRRGIARSSLAFVVIDYGGIGLGVISHGNLWSGRGGIGELAHLSIDRDGLPCPCGRRGCLGMYASAQVLLEKCQAFANVTPRAEDLPELARMATAGNVRVQEQIEQAGYLLGHGIVDVDRILRPAAVVVSSAHQGLENWYLAGIKRYVGEVGEGTSHEDLTQRIELAPFGSLSIAYGAAAMKLDEFFTAPLDAMRGLSMAD